MVRKQTAPTPVALKEGVQPGKDWWVLCMHPIGKIEYVQVKKLQYRPITADDFDKELKYNIRSKLWTNIDRESYYAVHIGCIAETKEEIEKRVKNKRISWPVLKPTDSDDLGSASEVDRLMAQPLKEAPAELARKKRKAAEADLEDLNAFINTGSLTTNGNLISSSSGSSSQIDESVNSSSQIKTKSKSTSKTAKNNSNNLNSSKKNTPGSKKKKRADTNNINSTSLSTNKSHPSKKNTPGSEKKKADTNNINSTSSSTNKSHPQNPETSVSQNSAGPSQIKSVSNVPALKSNNTEINSDSPQSSKSSCHSQNGETNASQNITSASLIKPVSKVNTPQHASKQNDSSSRTNVDVEDTDSTLCTVSGLDTSRNVSSNFQIPHQVPQPINDVISPTKNTSPQVQNLHAVSVISDPDSGVGSLLHPASGGEICVGQSFVVLSDGSLQADDKPDSSVLEKILSSLNGLTSQIVTMQSKFNALQTEFGDFKKEIQTSVQPSRFMNTAGSLCYSSTPPLHCVPSTSASSQPSVSITSAGALDSKVTLTKGVEITVAALRTVNTSTEQRQWCRALLEGVFGEDAAIMRKLRNKFSEPHIRPFPKAFKDAAVSLYGDFLTRKGESKSDKEKKKILGALSKVARDLDGRRNSGDPPKSPKSGNGPEKKTQNSEKSIVHIQLDSDGEEEESEEESDAEEEVDEEETVVVKEEMPEDV